MGKSSRRPANISKLKTSFSKGEKKAKFMVGPTFSSPGPMLFKADATDVKQVTRS